MRTLIVATVMLLCLVSTTTVLYAQPSPPPDPNKIQVLILTGQHVHPWRETTPGLKKILEDTGKFEVRINEEPRGLGPETLLNYDLVVVNYYNRGAKDRWGERAETALQDFVRAGKGLILYHLAVGAFDGWVDYEKMSGGSWRPMQGHHSARHDFMVDIKDPTHPITAGLKPFMMLKDELYANLRWQPEGTFKVLATAYDDHSLYGGKARQPIPGPGIHQPILWTTEYGKGRVFITALGHDGDNVRQPAFGLTFARGAEWAAKGVVTLPIPPELAAQVSTQAPPSVVFETNAHKIRIVTIAERLSNPWSIAFLPGGDMLVTERPGRLRLIRKGVLQAEPVRGIPEVRYRNHGGLMDIALHPNFAQNQLVYFTYSKPREKEATTALLRARFDGTQLVDAKDIFVADAWTTSDVNFGSRIVFAPDGTIFMTIGERNFPFPQNQGMSAQDVNTHMGKILRLRDDGTVPADNPFVGKAGHKPEIYSYGHRNPQGITIHPATGAVWASEHGPLGGDEANIILPGRNYGWPLITYGKGYDGKPVTEDTKREGMEQPRFYWVPSLGITNLLFYTGDRFPMWKGELIVAGHGAMLIQRVRQEGRGTNERESIVTPALRRRFRDLRQGPDGLLYVVASDKGDKEPNTGTVMRIEPAE